jgi:hypothetical protein
VFSTYIVDCVFEKLGEEKGFVWLMFQLNELCIHLEEENMKYLNKNGKYIRVDDKRALELAREGWEYCSKSKWKESTQTQSVKVEEPKVEEVVEEVEDKNTKKNKKSKKKKEGKDHISLREKQYKKKEESA